nr:nucleotide exchange factor GrpE [Desulfobacterales bacterium]
MDDTLNQNKSEQEDREEVSVDQTDAFESEGSSQQGTDTDKNYISRKELKEIIEAKEAEVKEVFDRLLRLKAEFENYKRRTEREKIEFRNFANESLIKEILPAIDNLERALEAPSGGQITPDSIIEGVDMTLKGLLNSLKKFGVVPIESLNQPFDPNYHQAVMQEESDKHPANTVIKELQKGYLINNRLLRPSAVVVSKGPTCKNEKKPGCSDKEEKIKEEENE